MSKVVELLSRPINFAIVQLPERSFPGVVVQGDTLNGLVNQLTKMGMLLTSKQLGELSDEIEDMREQLGEALAHYESVCAARGIELPYPKSSTV
jgi:hypothetical protein